MTFQLVDLLDAAVERVKLANKDGDPILSAWLPEAQKAIAKARETPRGATMSKWTSGPWKHDRDMITSGDGQIIAESPSGYFGDYDKWEANARLIAEAPAMAEAIRQAVECWNADEEDAGNCLPCGAKIGEDHVAGCPVVPCRALLARIEGQR